MNMKRWRKFACAACLSLLMAFAYQALASSAPSHPQPVRLTKVSGKESLLQGRRLIALGGYELNVSFTSDGKLVCFNISTESK